MNADEKIPIVVPIDFSRSSAPAIREAMKLATNKTDVRVVHVLPNLDSISPGVVWGGITDDSRMKHVTTYMQTWLASHDITDVRTEIVVGDPGQEIAKYANDLNAKLIVIPTHGHHGLKRALLGSVAERVIRYADCSVLALRRHDAD